MSREPTHRRYQPATGAEAGSQPGSRGRVLRNKPGIQRKREMDRAEFEALVGAQSGFLGQVTTETQFTAEMLCLMHCTWLGELYEWAWQYRTVEMEKGGFRWPPAYLVAQNMAVLEQGLLHRNTPCRQAPLDTVARRMAEVHAELLLIHPFRDGNGRLARWLADLMALQAGWPLPQYAFAGPGSRKEQESYIKAVTQGYLTRYDLLTDFFRAAVERRLRTSEAATGVRP